MFKAQVIIKRRPSILDPQGKAVEKGAQHLGLTNIKNTRIGKYIEFDVYSDNLQEAEKEVNEYCLKLLSNPIMEDYEFSLSEITNAEEV
jgi:phosphoribosylformylglycinamidine synthase